MPAKSASTDGPARARQGATAQPPRERIVESARDLFHRHGIRGVGVETIAEAAGTNKMTLYRHFASKDDLIIACLNQRACDVEAMWRELEAAHPGKPLAQLRGWVRRAAHWLETDTRGCDLANAAVELPESDHPAKRVIEDFKRRQRDRLAALCRDAGIPEADLLADALSLALEGARVSRQSAGAEGPSARFVRVSEAIIACFAKRRVSPSP